MRSCPRCQSELIEHPAGWCCTDEECPSVGETLVMCMRNWWLPYSPDTCGFSGCPSLLPRIAELRGRLLGLLLWRAGDAELGELGPLDAALRALGALIRAESSDAAAEEHMAHMWRTYVDDGSRKTPSTTEAARKLEWKHEGPGAADFRAMFKVFDTVLLVPRPVSPVRNSQRTVNRIKRKLLRWRWPLRRRKDAVTPSR